ncbi:MAG: ABC transporter ATP-binding protein, partial [Patescibacteria group bacterium]
LSYQQFRRKNVRIQKGIRATKPLTRNGRFLVAKFFRKFYAIYRPFRWAMFAMFCFTFVGQVLNLAPALVVGKLLNDLIAYTRNPDGNVESMKWVASELLALLLVILLLQNVVLRYLRERVEIKYIDRSIPFHASSLTLHWLLSLSPSQHQQHHSSIKETVIADGQNALEALGRMLVYNLVPMCCEIVIVTVALFFMHPALGAIVFTGIILFFACAYYVNRVTWVERQKVQQMDREQDQQHSEIVHNIELVLANAQEAKTAREYLDGLAKIDEYWRKVYRRIALLSTYRDTVVDITKVCVLAFGTYLIVRGDFAPGYLVVFANWSFIVLARMGAVGNMQRELMRHLDHLHEYFKFTELKSDVTTVKNPIVVDRFRGGIEFRSVTMTYAAQPKPAITNVSFTIAPGECVALVGESGAGKTTITRAILRYQDPDAGQILIDGNDLRLLDYQQFRTAVGRVEQDVTLFDATLRYNLTFGLGDRVVTDEEILHACQLACVDRFLPRMPKGLDTVIGERGQRLSGGEKQRVGIARALLKNPAILIFDEATSNLDAENEFWIQEAIAKAAVGRTTIIIAHRFSTIQRVDRAIVFEKGAVVGSGTHAKLDAECEEYQRLVRRQLTVIS